MIGPMGVGKTTVGRQLAIQLSCQFYDVDAEIESAADASVSLIFEQEGETGFRQRETDVLSCLIVRSRIVIATGGGIVLSAKNRELLKSSGFCIYLNAPAAYLYKRMAGDTTRPLLQGHTDRLKQIEQILEQRKHYYHDLADVSINVETLDVSTIVQQIMDVLE